MNILTASLFRCRSCFSHRSEQLRDSGIGRPSSTTKGDAMRWGRLIIAIGVFGSAFLAGCQRPREVSVVSNPSEDGPNKEGSNAKGSPAFAPDAGAWQTKETKVLDAAKANEAIGDTKDVI